jgi:hypothetical protein
VTGWLLDGGFLMWICYGGALVSACRMAYRIAIDRSTMPSLRDLAVTVVAFQIAVIGLCLSAPVFNTQLGIVFWALTGALAGVQQSRR